MPTLDIYEKRQQIYDIKGNNALKEVYLAGMQAVRIANLLGVANMLQYVMQHVTNTTQRHCELLRP